MKITQEHYNQLKRRIQDFSPLAGLIDCNLQAYLDRDPSIPNIDKAKDLQKRFRWDLFWGANIRITDTDGMHVSIQTANPGKLFLPLYDYMDDTHIDTALKKIVKELVPAHKHKELGI